MKRPYVWLSVLTVLIGLPSLAPSQRPAPRLPEGTKAYRDLEYVKGGHQRNKLDLYVPEKPEGLLPVIV